MHLASHFPGLGLTVEQLDEMTPAQIGALVTAGRKVLKLQADERWAELKAIALVRSR